MKTIETRLGKVGNLRGVRLPALKPQQPPEKLTWEETYKEMAASDEDWSDWEGLPDGWDDE